jgi:hypothetical protein
MIEPMPHRIDSFVIKFLQLDGVSQSFIYLITLLQIFILRLMANHAGDIIVMQVVVVIFENMQI